MRPSFTSRLGSRAIECTQEADSPAHARRSPQGRPERRPRHDRAGQVHLRGAAHQGHLVRRRRPRRPVHLRDGQQERQARPGQPRRQECVVLSLSPCRAGSPSRRSSIRLAEDDQGSTLTLHARPRRPLHPHARRQPQLCAQLDRRRGVRRRRAALHGALDARRRRRLAGVDRRARQARAGAQGRQRVRPGHRGVRRARSSRSLSSCSFSGDRD